jgi:hypothetical protein
MTTEQMLKAVTEMLANANPAEMNWPNSIAFASAVAAIAQAEELKRIAESLFVLVDTIQKMDR